MKIFYSQFIIENILSDISARTAIIRKLSDSNSIASIIKELDQKERSYLRWDIHNSCELDVDEIKSIHHMMFSNYKPSKIFDSNLFNENTKDFSKFSGKRFWSQGGFTENKLTIEIITNKEENDVIAWIINFN